MRLFSKSVGQGIQRIPVIRSEVVLSRRTLASLLLFLFFALFIAPQQFSFAQSDAIEDAKNALKQGDNYPWYDAEQDDLRRVDVYPEKAEDNANRASTWETQPAQQKTQRNWDWSALTTMARVFVVTLIIILLSLLVWLIVWIFSKTETWRSDKAELTQVAESGSDVDRVESLPFKVDKPYGDLLAEARRQYEAGNYRDAVIYLFSYKLIQLDKNQFIHLTKGKTNRQYLRELRSQSRLFGLLEGTMLAFEDVFFGNHELQRQEFESCWQGLDEFHSLVNQGASL